jgi:hypothetical protein
MTHKVAVCTIKISRHRAVFQMPVNPLAGKARILP